MSDDFGIALEAKCFDCGLDYEHFPLDVVLPDAQWRMLLPECNGEGLLCAACIVKRAAARPDTIIVFAQVVDAEAHSAFSVLKNVPLARVAAAEAALLRLRQQVEQLPSTKSWDFRDELVKKSEVLACLDDLGASK